MMLMMMNDDENDVFLTRYTPLPLLKTLKTTSTKKHTNCPTTSLLPSSSSILVYFLKLALLETIGWLDFLPPIPSSRSFPKNASSLTSTKESHRCSTIQRLNPQGGSFQVFLCLEDHGFFDIFISKSLYMENSMFIYIPCLLSIICRDLEIFAFQWQLFN